MAARCRGFPSASAPYAWPRWWSCFPAASPSDSIRKILVQNEMKIPFIKMHGAGNDFILVDDRERVFPLDDAAFIQRICCRRTGIGCDGVILLQSSDSADVRMRIMNSDGGEVEMCGNGARCLARLAYELEAAPSNMTIETGAGMLSAEVLGEQIRLLLTDPVDLKLDLETGLEWPVDFVNTGVPHAVAWEKRCANTPCLRRMERTRVLRRWRRTDR